MNTPNPTNPPSPNKNKIKNKKRLKKKYLVTHVYAKHEANLTPMELKMSTKCTSVVMRLDYGHGI